jgi:diguanylate cyclase (GGDEF)-like protein
MTLSDRERERQPLDEPEAASAAHKAFGLAAGLRRAGRPAISKCQNRQVPLSFGIIFLGLCIIAMLWSTLFYESRRSHDAALDQARRDAGNLTMAFREDILRTASAIDQLMITVIADQPANEFRLPQWLDHSPLLKGMAVQVALADANGIVQASNLGLSGRVDVSDRPHFRYHRDAAAPQPYISTPVLGRVSNKWSIQFTRRIEREDGGFAGIVIVSVDPSYFSKFFDSVNLGRSGVAALVGLDGIVRARRTLGGEGIGQDISASELFQHIRENQIGTYLAHGKVDGVERVFGYATVTEYPLLVVLGIATDDVLVAPRQRMKWLFFVGAALSILIAAMTWFLAHETNRRRRRELAEQIERRTRDQKLQLDTALSYMPQGLLMFDSAERLVVCNDQYIKMYDLSGDIVKPGCTFIELLKHRAEQGHLRRDPEQYRTEVLVDIRSGKATSRIVETADGREILIKNQSMPDGGWVVTHEDITEQRAAQAKISHMALHDALTDLPNRVLLRQQLEDRLAHMERDLKFAVLCLDLDRFKSVNDSLGHKFGDQLLNQVADRLRACLREGDIVARLGGDEFAILQCGITQPTETTALAARLIEAIGEPFDLGGHQVVVGLSAGIAIAPTDATDPDQLLMNADLALYRAKADGRATYRFFEPGMDARMQARRSLELDLRKALVNGEFELHYQPLVNLKDDTICGFEALLRWNHPVRGMVMPLDFIPLAEETALIVPIGEWVLRQACEEAAKWPSHVGVAVNLSPAQFKNPGLSQTVVSALARAGLAPRRLELEITESVLLANTDSTYATLHRLRALGVRISMDDFGTGYSSLSYLRSFPFDKIKIDRSFVRDLPSNADSMAIIRAVTGLGCSLGMATTGEGVETREELECLRQEGCTEAQGYYFSRPKPASEVHKLLAKQGASVKAVA